MGYVNFLKNFYKEKFKTQVKDTSVGINKFYNDIGIFTPKIGTTNLGDKIIYKSVKKVLRNIFPDDLFTDLPTQFHTTYDAKKIMGQKDLLFVAGTNLLSSNLDAKYQWKINSGHKKYLENKVVLFGCGWWQYQDDINAYTEDIYRTILNKEVIHSVRDQYTADKLSSIGIDNALNTTCPSLWSVTPDECKKIPMEKGESVITTLTFYKKDPELDYKMLHILSHNYKKVYLWIQGMKDLQYLNDINDEINNLEIVPPTIAAYNNRLEQSNIDYIGTRLHAGIKALQKNIRTLIIAVDNRAYEIGKDVNLNVLKREKIDEINSFINGVYETDIKLPSENIELFINSLKSWKIK